ncbi:hypothetical protein NLG97_g4281 [Lecanicillium saksenae]|uniref:Uncharacterized protein n=1 Tax=Lecanicillium saksenae TaxID=468837 RepID=A0ACC1QWB0_9HYPO|nr:hypothetical protein NLG97_g4281 [Lecanicillium saksenae]
MSLKDKISSPLEAGTSLLDAHHLPPQLLPALDSSRLPAAALTSALLSAAGFTRLTLTEPLYQTPPPTTMGPTDFLFSSVRHLIHSDITPIDYLFAFIHAHVVGIPEIPTRAALASLAHVATYTDDTPLATTYDAVDGTVLHRDRGLLLWISHGTTARAEKALQAALAKANRKSNSGAHIAPALSAPACGFNAALFNNSIAQNDVLFSSDGLSLISFDRLYSLKAALSSYSKTGSPLRLEDAVDELRRYVLASGKKVSKMHLMRSYDWLSVSHSALADLDRMYRRAYGGVEMQGGIDGMYFAPVPESSVWSDDEDDDEEDEDDQEIYHDQDSGVYVEGIPDSPTIEVATIGMAVATTTVPIQLKRSPSPKMPLLRVQTSFVKTPAVRHIDSIDVADNRKSEQKQPEAEEDVLTARPDDDAGEAAAIRNQLWRNTQSTSIDQVLSPGPDPPPRDQDGPMTPNGYDDISPITRGEWGFLMVDRDFQNARTVAVTTC